MAVPFSLDGRQVHCEGTISSKAPSSEVKVPFPGERPSVVARRDRLFEVVALTALSKRCDRGAMAAARGSSLGEDDDDDMSV